MTNDMREPPATTAAKTPMTQAVVRTTRNSVVLRLAERYQVEAADFLQTVKATLLPGNVSNEHLMAFLMVADQYRLNPLTKQIYAFPGKGGGIVPIVGIDGWYQIANAHPEYDGLTFDDHAEDGALVSITAKVFRKDRSHPISVTEYMSECAGTSEPWKRWPARMLRHKAAIQAIRAAFGLAGIYDPDEGERIIEATAAVKPTGSRVAQLEAAIAQQPDPDTLPDLIDEDAPDDEGAAS